MPGGILAHVPNKPPRFVPLSAADLPPCLEQVADSVRCILVETFKLFNLEYDFRIVYATRELEDERAAGALLEALGKGKLCSVRVLFRLLGGKGGFGSLLRGQKGRGKKKRISTLCVIYQVAA